MKRFATLALSAGLAAAFSISCVREALPLNSYPTSEQVAASGSGLAALANGIPAIMVKHFCGNHGSSTSDFDFSYPSLMISLDTAAGELVICGSAYYDWFMYWGNTNSIIDETTNRSYVPWSTLYQYVLSANNIIGVIDAGTALGMEKAYLGAAYAFRAFAYLYLVRIYEFKQPSDPSVSSSYKLQNQEVLTRHLTVPIVTESTTEKELINNPRAPREDVYALILSDLDKAEALLGDTDPGSRTLPDISVVYGLKARTYLELGSQGADGAFESAANYAKKSREAFSGNPLTQEQWESPSNGFNSYTANSNSWMWYVSVAKEDVYSNANFVSHMSTEQNWNEYGFQTCRGINRNLYETIPDTDFRKHSWIDPGRKSYYAYKTNHDIDSPDEKKYYIANYANLKFRPAGGEIKTCTEGGASSIPVMRMEEMYLIEAEALAMSGRLGEGQQVLDELVTTRDPSYSSAVLTSDALSFQKEVFRQKRIEFWGEGLVFFDFKRLEAGISRGYSGTNAPEGYRFNVSGTAPRWNWCIPTSELNNNPAIQGMNNPSPDKSLQEWN